MTKKEQTVQITVKITQTDYENLQKLSSKTHKPLAEIVRGFIKNGMDVERSKDDIDFIRRQLREELQLQLKPNTDRVAKMLMRIGMMTVTFCYFASKIFYHFMPWRDKTSYEEMMAEAKRNAAAYLSMRDASLDTAYKDFQENN